MERGRSQKVQNGASSSSAASSSQTRKSPPRDYSAQACASGYSPRSPRPSKSNTTPPRHLSPSTSPLGQEIPDSFPPGRKSPRNQQGGPQASMESQCNSIGWPINYLGAQGFDDWGDDSILAAVLAQSQQEYYENLTRQNNNNMNNNNSNSNSNNNNSSNEDFTNKNIPNMDPRNNYPSPNRQ